MKAFGASSESIDNAISERKMVADREVSYCVEHENWPAYEIFCMVQTQWNIHGFSGRVTGLRYSPLIDVIKLMHQEDNVATIFRKVQLIEHGYLMEINK